MSVSHLDSSTAEAWYEWSGNLPQVSSTERNRCFRGEENEKKNEVDTFNLKRNGLVKIGARNCLPDITLRVSFPGYIDSSYSPAPSSSVVPIVRGYFLNC